MKNSLNRSGWIGAISLIPLLMLTGAACAHMADMHEHLVKPGVITLGLALTGRPLSYREDGDLKGFDVDLLRAVARSSRLGLNVVQLPRDGLLNALLDRRVDAINTGTLGHTPPNSIRVVPYLVTGDPHGKVRLGQLHASPSQRRIKRWPRYDPSITALGNPKG